MQKYFLGIALTLPLLLFAQQQVSFTASLPKVGQTWVRTANYTMDVDVLLKFAGETLAEHNDASTFIVRKAETVLGVSGDAITKLKVTYEQVERRKVTTEDGIPMTAKPDKSPVLGRSYLVSVENDAVKVVDLQQLKPSPEELEIVENDYQELGDADGFHRFLNQKTVQVGESMQMPGVMAEGIFTDSERRRVRVDNAFFVLKNVRQEVAVFDTALKMQWNQDANTSIKMNLTGETLVGVSNARMVSTKLQGTVRVTGTDQLYNRLVMVDGKGKISISETVRPK